MAQSADSPDIHSKTESPSFWKKAGSEAIDFGEGLYHGAVENPINGAIQVTNHVFTSAHLPEVHLVDEDRLNHSFGGVAGSIAGQAIDMYGATVATGGLAGVGYVGAALRFGAVGAAYTTLLQPTDANSQHFLGDRLTNGAIALGTFAAMGGAGAVLDKFGSFAVSGARSLVGNLTYGGLAGAVGGLAHAEGSSILKDGKAFPTLSALAADTATYGAFGIAYGGATYAYSQFSNTTREFTTDKSTAKVTFDAQGNAVKVDSIVPSIGDTNTQVHFTGVKTTDGNWATKANEQASWRTAIAPPIDDVQVNGDTLTIKGPDGIDRQYENGGNYTRTDSGKVARTAAEQQYYDAHNISDTVNGVTVQRHYDAAMRLQQMETGSHPGTNGASSASVLYDDGGSVNYVSMQHDGQALTMVRQTDNTWKYTDNNQSYKWSGAVQVVSSGASGAEHIQFTPANGNASSSFDLSSGIKPVGDLVHASATYIPGGTGNAAIAVDDSGKITLTGSTNFQRQFVNGKQIPDGQSVDIHPGDDVKIKVDVGDAYPVWETRTVDWGTAADGTPVFGTTPLKPGTRLDFNPDDSSTRVTEPAKS